MNRPYFVHSSVGGHLDFFHLLAIKFFRHLGSLSWNWNGSLRLGIPTLYFTNEMPRARGVPSSNQTFVQVHSVIPWQSPTPHLTSRLLYILFLLQKINLLGNLKNYLVFPKAVLGFAIGLTSTSFQQPLGMVERSYLFYMYSFLTLSPSILKSKLVSSNCLFCDEME